MTEWLEERKDLLLILKEIAEGKIQLNFQEIDRSGFALFDSTAGWKFLVFVDHGDFDYIDRFMRVGETQWVEVGENEPLFWRPSERQAKEQWHWEKVRAAHERWLSR